jgi:hypothetical protein
LENFRNLPLVGDIRHAPFHVTLFEYLHTVLLVGAFIEVQLFQLTSLTFDKFSAGLTEAYNLLEILLLISSNISKRPMARGGTSYPLPDSKVVDCFNDLSKDNDLSLNAHIAIACFLAAAHTTMLERLQTAQNANKFGGSQLLTY